MGRSIPLSCFTTNISQRQRIYSEAAAHLLETRNILRSSCSNFTVATLKTSILLCKTYTLPENVFITLKSYGGCVFTMVVLCQNSKSYV